jgi:N-acetylneuraminic acid mutarotase
MSGLPHTPICLVPVALLILGFSTGEARADATRTLTFEDRVIAQQAIERMYYSHQVGATRPFEQAVPRELLERKVRTYLRQSAALQSLWGTELTEKMLQAELERIARRSRYPDRLMQIYEALGNDPLLVRECFVRPILANRLARNFFAYDQRIHASSRLDAESLHGRLRDGEVDSRAQIARRTVVRLRSVDALTSHLPEESSAGAFGRSGVDLPADEFAHAREETPRRVGEVGALREGRDGFEWSVLLDETGDSIEIARYSVPKQSWDAWWAGVEESLAEAPQTAVQHRGDVLPLPIPPVRSSGSSVAGGFAESSSLPENAQGSCVPDDTWANGSLDAVPKVLTGSTAVWTGTEMIVWGGAVFSSAYNRGWRYDPLVDSWMQVSTVNAPAGRIYHSAIWTGSRMIVWGGESNSVQFKDGAQYAPATDTWTLLPNANAPLQRSRHTAVWTGSQMIIWGGGLSGFGRYDVATNAWIPASTAGAPSQRLAHSAVWTGSEMIIWGGTDNSVDFSNGGRYNPSSDTWTAVSTTGAPSARRDHTAAWTGSQMIVWGGRGSAFFATGARYNPSTDTWLPTSATDAPPARSLHTAVWTGTDMLVWGGLTALSEVTTATGGRYDPASDLWRTISPVNAPAARYQHTAVWAGDLMLVWGSHDVQARPAGGRYEVGIDVWTPLTDGGVPVPRQLHSAVWTGTEMLVWGGVIDDSLTTANTGGRYDPLADSWTATAMLGVPAARTQHVAVWTGEVMVVWGGLDGSVALSSGGRYDPIADLWASTSLVGAPPAAYLAVGAWTGKWVLAWGGTDGVDYVGTGGRYDPETDAWAAITLQNAPTPRFYHTGVWTGSRFVIWGGESATGREGAGGNYDPSSNSWQTTTSAGAPSPREWHSAVWAGGRMVVWGGISGSGPALLGGRYDPTMDAWTLLPTGNAPAPRSSAVAVSTGSRAIFWGGYIGGSRVNTGGVYDSATNSWMAMSTTDAPTPRSGATMIWAGGVAMVWGGHETVSMGGGELLALQTNTGGAYGVGNFEDGDQDGESICAGDCDDSRPSVHLGAAEICDGLDSDCDGAIPPGEVDGDGDGVPVCAPDCDDGDPSRFPGNPEMCDNVDNDCDGTADGFATSCGIGPCASTGMCIAGADSCTPGAASAEVCDGVDNDCDGPVDEANPGGGAPCSTGLPGVCGAGITLCQGGQLACLQSTQPSVETCDNLDNDCNGTVDGFATTCGVGACAASGACTAGSNSCAPHPPTLEVCNGADDDCNGFLPADEADMDGDGVALCAGDCDDAQAATFPAAPEVNDGADNQCPGDDGAGLTDEISGDAGFPSVASPQSYCWPAQMGAWEYEVARSPLPGHSAGCTRVLLTSACWEDAEVPPSRGVFFYLVRARNPYTGSWGQNSALVERGEMCGPEVCGDGLDNDADGFVDCEDVASCFRTAACPTATLQFLDGPTDDLAPAALASFLGGVDLLPTDFIALRLEGGYSSDFEWCAERADFFRNTYLALSPTGGSAPSQGWQVWSRTGGGSWTGPVADTYVNYYGAQCFGPYSWCSEVGLGGRAPTIDPDDELACEARDPWYGCGAGDVRLTIVVGAGRLAVCGF